MRQYQLYVRLHELDQWSYAETFTSPATVWTGMQMARDRGCACKVVTSQRIAMDGDVLSVQS